jgi:hypothetical protein
MMYVHNIDTLHKNTQNIYYSSKPWVRLGLTIIIITMKLSVKSLSLSAPLYLLFQWFPQNKEILLNISVWNAETQYLMHKVRE